MSTVVGIFLILLLLAVIVGTVSYMIMNLLKKVEVYEDTIEQYEAIINNQQEYVKKVSSIIMESRLMISQIDERGIFEADDDIGTFFRYLKEVQELLNTFIVIQTDGKS